MGDAHALVIAPPMPGLANRPRLVLHWLELAAGNGEGPPPPLDELIESACEYGARPDEVRAVLGMRVEELIYPR